MWAAASRHVRASSSRWTSAGSVGRAAEHHGRQQAVVQLRETTFQDGGRVAIADADERPAADPLHDDRRPADGDGGQHDRPHGGRRLEKPIDGQRGPKGRAQPRHRGAAAFQPDVSAQATPQGSEPRRDGGGQERLIVDVDGGHVNRSLRGTGALGGARPANNASHSRGRLCYILILRQFHQPSYQPLETEQAAQNDHHPTQPGLLPLGVRGNGLDDGGGLDLSVAGPSEFGLPASIALGMPT